MPAKKTKQLRPKRFSKKNNFPKIILTIISVLALFGIILLSAKQTAYRSEASNPNPISAVKSSLSSGRGDASVSLAGVTTGNLIVVGISVYQGTITVSDNAGNIYNKAVEQPLSGYDRVAIYYAQNVTGGDLSIRAHSSASTANVTISAHEYSGALTSNALDKIQSAMVNSDSTVINSGNTPVTTQANELVFGIFGFSKSITITATAGNGFTMRQSQGNNYTYEALFAEDKLVTAAGAYNATFTAGKSVKWRAAVATFKAADQLQPSPTPEVTASPFPTENQTPGPTQPMGCSQQDIQNLVNSVSMANITANLKELVQDDSKPVPNELISRYIASPGNKVKTDWIFQTVSGYGLPTQLQPFTDKRVNLNNVVAVIPGTDPNVVYGVGAHFDSISENRKVAAPGAEDNGSGTVVWMEVARVLNNFRSCMKSTINFVGFNDEEIAGKGASTYVDSLNGKSMKGFYNMDMVGYTPQGECLKSDSNLSVDVPVAQELVDMNTKYNIGINVSTGRYTISDIDNADFWAANLPSAYLVDCATETNSSNYQYYHNSQDTTPNINFFQLTKIAKLLVATLAELASQ